jgi:hypothetical protein
VSDNDSSINQKQGVINKCPNCGGTLKAFATRCELCGYELAGVGANKTISNLVSSFSAIEAELAAAGLSGSKLERELAVRKGRVIREFVIPNTRDDLQSLIYYIHPKIQNNIKPDPNSEDWRVKFKEVLNLAKIAYKGDAKTREEFDQIEKSLNISLSNVLETRAKRSPFMAIGVALVVILVIVGIAGTQYDNWKLKQCQDRYAQGVPKEKARLDGIVAEANAKLQAKRFTDALAVLNNLHWDYQDACNSEDAKRSKSDWEGKRQSLTVLIQKAQADDSSQQNELAQRAAEEKRAVEERAESARLADQAKKMSDAHKAAVDREW